MIACYEADNYGKCAAMLWFTVIFPEFKGWAQLYKILIIFKHLALNNPIEHVLARQSMANHMWGCSWPDNSKSNNHDYK